MNKCVFLDRDGVLNQDIEGYLFQPDDVQIPPGVAEGLRTLQDAGYLLIVITNQAGIAKGLYTANEVRAVHERIQMLTGIQFTDLYFAPEHPDYTTRSLFSKPDSLMIEKALAKYKIDASKSWMVGDKERDITAGIKAGVKTILISEKALGTQADSLAANFEQAVSILLNT